jgi:hypothetical protein
VLEVRNGQIKLFGSSLFVDGNNDGMADGALTIRGWNASIASGGTALNLAHNDADAYFDFLDIDADGDGITDNIEIQTTFLPGAGYLLPGTADVDNDGIIDTYDSNTSAFGGARLTAVDTDSDGTPDYLDLDTDNDAQPDIIEGNDFNQNRIVDDYITPANVDTDGDGLDNTFDNDNSNPYVTSSLLGSGGTYTGPSPYGTRSVVTNSYPGTQYDRDWRFNGMILSVNLLQFSGNLYNQVAHLGWTYIANEPVARMVIERSTNGLLFEKAGEVAGTNILSVPQSFGFDDALHNIPAQQYYYRLRIIGTSGREKMSNIVVLRPQQKGSNAIEIMPVPANNWFNMTLRTPAPVQARIELIDASGKTVLQRTEKLLAGANVIHFSDVSRFGTGIYQVRAVLNGEVLHARLLIQ